MAGFSIKGTRDKEISSEIPRDLFCPSIISLMRTKSGNAPKIVEESES